MLTRLVPTDINVERHGTPHARPKSSDNRNDNLQRVSPTIKHPPRICNATGCIAAPAHCAGNPSIFRRATSAVENNRRGTRAKLSCNWASKSAPRHWLETALTRDALGARNDGYQLVFSFCRTHQFCFWMSRPRGWMRLRHFNSSGH